MSQKIDYVFNNTQYASLELARQAAVSWEEGMFSELDRFCKITIVEPHSEIPNTFIENNQRIDFDCRTLDDSDPRYFNICSVTTGNSYQGLQAVELKIKHKEMFKAYVDHEQLKFVKEMSFPSRLIDNPESPLQENDVFSQVTHSSNSNFDYTSE